MSEIGGSITERACLVCRALETCGGTGAAGGGCSCVKGAGIADAEKGVILCSVGRAGETGGSVGAGGTGIVAAHACSYTSIIISIIAEAA